MTYVDGCETEGCDNTEPSVSTVPLTNGDRAAFICTDCGHAWTTDFPREDT